MVLGLVHSLNIYHVLIFWDIYSFGAFFKAPCFAGSDAYGGVSVPVAGFVADTVVWPDSQDGSGCF